MVLKNLFGWKNQAQNSEILINKFAFKTNKVVYIITVHIPPLSLMKKTRRHNDHQSISDVLKDFVDTNKLQKGIDQVEVVDVWKRVMGPAISKYTTQIKLQRNTLYVQLSSSVLREELSYGVSKIAKNINEELGRELVMKVVLR